jgi:predicted nucleic acid-binding protein
LVNYFKNQKNLTPQKVKGKLKEHKAAKQSEATINQFIKEANLKKSPTSI